MYQRKQCYTFFSGMQGKRRFIQLIMDPRQVGKSSLMKQVVNAFGIPFVFYPADAAPATQLSRITDCWNAARARMRVEGLKELILVLNTNANSQHAALPGFAMLIQRASLREPSRGGGGPPREAPREALRKAL